MPTIRSRCLLLAVLAAAGSASTVRAQTTATWVGPGSGVWDDPLKWSTNPFYPDKDNPLGTTYNAFLPTLGTGAYTVTLNRAITLTDLNITHTDATLDLTDFNMTLERNLNLTGGGKLIGTGGGGTGQISISGLTTIASSSIAGVSRVTATGGTTLSDGMIDDIPQYVSQGIFTFSGSTQDEICDTGIGHGGTACQWIGTGDIMFAGSSSFQHGASSVFTITNDKKMYWDGMGTQATFVNDGVIVKTTGTGETFFQDIDLTISATGTLRVQTGTFHSNQLTNIAGGNLNTGTFEINSVLEADGADITALGTKFTLDGAGAKFVDQTGTASGFRNLANLNAGADLNLRNGTSLSVSGGLNLAGNGKLTADTGVAVTTAGGGNIVVGGTAAMTIKGAGSTLSDGGDLTVSSTGAFTADTGAVVTQGAGRAVTVQNTGSLTVQGTGTSFTSGGAVNVNDTSSLSVKSDGLFTTGGNTQINGTLSVQGTNSKFQVGTGSSLLNITGGTITGGTFDINAGTVQVDSADVNTVGSKISLTGSTAQFIQTGGQSVIRNLATIATTGDLTFATGLTFNAVGGLNINSGGKLTANAVGTQVKTNGDVTVGATGTLSVGSGATVEVAPTFTVTNFSGGTFTSGVFNVAGTLRFNPDQPVKKIGGDIKFGSATAGIVTFAATPVFAPVDTVLPTGKFRLEQGFQFATQGTLGTRGLISIGKPGSDVETILTVNGDLNQDEGVVSLDEGRLIVTGTYNIAPGASLEGMGTVEGTINNQGTISPGITTGLRGGSGETGILSILGSFTAELHDGDPGDVLLKMQVGGTVAGAEYDQLMISNALTLADGIGAVDLSLIPGYSPVDGDSYNLITFASHTGRFAEYRAPQPGGGFFEFHFTDTALVATFHIPSPGAGSLMFAALGLCGARRRRA